MKPHKLSKRRVSENRGKIASKLPVYDTSNFQCLGVDDDIGL